MAKRPRVSPERRRFESRTLAELAGAGASAALLRRCRWLLTRGRAREGADVADVLNLRSQERAGIEALRRRLQGKPLDAVIVRLHPGPPPVSYHG